MEEEGLALEEEEGAAADSPFFLEGGGGGGWSACCCWLFVLVSGSVPRCTASAGALAWDLAFLMTGSVGVEGCGE